jgi:hypothetical protein
MPPDGFLNGGKFGQGKLDHTNPSPVTCHFRFFFTFKI